MIWIALALGILWFAMRLYVAGRDKGYQPDLPFEEHSSGLRQTVTTDKRRLEVSIKSASVLAFICLMV